MGSPAVQGVLPSRSDRIGKFRVTQRITPNGKLHLAVTNTDPYGRLMQWWYEIDGYTN